MGDKRRKVCFVITSFIHYSRSMFVLEELRERGDVELHIAIGGTALLSKDAAKHAHVRTLLLQSGFDKLHDVYFSLEGDEHISKAKTVGLGVIEFSTLFNDLRPDIVVVRGDRFEVLGAAVAAAYMGIPVAHIEGGDLSGTLDETVRHAVTKLSYLHFATNDPARERIVKMGEDPARVFNFGSPEIEIVRALAKNGHEVDLFETGSGAKIELGADFLLVMFHPVFAETEKMSDYTRVLLDAVCELDMPTLWFWPNADAGGEAIAHELRKFKDEIAGHTVRFTKYLPPKDFIALLKNASCLVGNSSAGIKESSYLGIPVVNVGSRQSDRLRAKNVRDVAFEKGEIVAAVKQQVAKRRYEPSELYFKEGTGKAIAETLATAPLAMQKRFFEGAI